MRDTGKGLWESRGRLDSFQLPGFSDLPQSSLLTRILTSRLLFSDTSYMQPPQNSSAEAGVWSIPTAYRLGIVQLLSHVRLFATPWTAPCQASLSFTIYRSLLKFMSIELVVLPSHSLLPLSRFTFSLSQHQGLFQWTGSLHQMAKVLELQLQHQFFQWIFRVSFL